MKSNNQIKVNKAELDRINQLIDNQSDWFDTNQIEGYEYILVFNHREKAMELDELIKDKLVYQGFDMNYNPNRFGQVCENLIDKLHEILNWNASDSLVNIRSCI